MRAWFLAGALILGLITLWGDQGRTTRTVRAVPGSGTVSTMDDPNPAPTPKAP